MPKQRKTNLITLVVVLMFFVFGNLSYGAGLDVSKWIPLNLDGSLTRNTFTNRTISTSQSGVGRTTPRPTASNRPQQGSHSYEMGEEFVLWDTKYKVLSAVDRGSQLSSGSRFSTPLNSNGKFVVITIEATNVGTDRKGVNKIILRDSQGRNYEVRSDIGVTTRVSGNQYGTSERYDGSISPGISHTYTAVFEVASDSEGLRLAYPSAGGPIVAEISLGF